MRQDRSDFSTGSIPATITRLSLPLIGAEIINALYSVVDRMYIGRIPGVGALALTGVGVTFPFVMLVSAFAALAAMGGAPLASIARGERDEARAERIMGNSFTLLLIFGATLTGLCLLVKGPALYLFGASEDTFPFANQYLTIYLCGSVFVMIALGMNEYISIQGFPRVAMISVVIGAVANIALDPLFIFVLNMGVSGAAWATVLAQAMSAAWVIRFLTGQRCILRLRRKSMRLEPKLVKRMLGLGLSTFVMQVNDSLVSIVCNSSLQRYGGDVYVGVMTVISSVRHVITMPLSGFSRGALPVLGFNYGAKCYARVRKATMFVLKVCGGYAFAVWALIMLLPAPFIRLFSDDAALLSAGVPSLRLYFSMFLFMSLQMTGQRCFVAMGRAKQAIFFSMLRKTFIVVPLTLLLPGVFGLGVRGVFMAEAVSDVIGPVSCFTTFMLTEWKKLREPGAELG